MSKIKLLNLLFIQVSKEEGEKAEVLMYLSADLKCFSLLAVYIVTLD